MLEARIVSLAPSSLVGISRSMSLVGDATQALFQQFMPQRRSILHQVDSSVVWDLRVYPADYFESFSPEATFTKWAAVEVHQADSLPDGMESFPFSGGTYAVFAYDRAAAFPIQAYFAQIFTEWLPNSSYRLAHRPHVDRLSPGSSREDIMIPIEPA